MADNVPTTAAAFSATASSGSSKADASSRGLMFDRHFTRPGVSPFDELTWEFRDAVIQDFKGKIIFEQKNVEVPTSWSMTATNIVASKYLHGQVGTPDRESGVRALVSRVAESIRDWGKRDGYFASEEDAEIFFAELCHLLLNQKAAFNSPVWFNVGCDRLEPNSDAQNWHWDATLGEYLLDWDDIRTLDDPHAAALEFAGTVFQHACLVCAWDPVLASSAKGAPPPIRRGQPRGGPEEAAAG